MVAMTEVPFMDVYEEARRLGQAVADVDSFVAETGVCNRSEWEEIKSANDRLEEIVHGGGDPARVHAAYQGGYNEAISFSYKGVLFN